MKKILSFILMIMLLFNIMAVGYGQENVSSEKSKEIRDMSGHWAEEIIIRWLENDLITGYQDGTIKPDANITKAEFITLINRIYGYNNEAEENYADVKEGDWYFKAVAIAKANRYMAWLKEDKLLPNVEITRQEVCAILSAIMQLKETEELTTLKKFIDNDTISEWSKGFIDAVVTSGYMKGYPDGTLKPLGNITRAETVAMLDRIIGEFINSAGKYGPEEGIRTVEGNLTISTENVVLKNTTINGDLILAAGIKDGDVDLENVIVKGKTIINGGGENSITFKGSTLGEIIVYKQDGKIRVVCEDSEIGKVILQSESKLKGKFKNVELLGKGSKVVLEGSFENIIVQTAVEIIVNGETTIDDFEISKSANGSTIVVGEDAEIKDLTLNAQTSVSGSGSVGKIEINADGINIDGISIEQEGKKKTNSNRPVSDTTKPIMDNGILTVTNVTTDGFDVNWTKAKDNKTSQINLEYQVYYSTSDNISSWQDAENNGTLAGSEKDINTMTITGLSKNTKYYYNVVVKDEAGNKVAYTAGSETTATSTAGDIVPPTVNTATLTATNITTDGFDVNWTIATDNKTSQINLEYQVYYSTSDNISTWQNAEINGTPVGSYTKNIEIKTITNLSENTKYYYNVVVKDEAGNKTSYTSGNVTTMTASDTVPPTVDTKALTATNITTDRFDVNWTKATDNKTSQINLEYQVYYSTSDNISTWQNAENNGTLAGSEKDINTMTITGLAENTKYYYNVVVKDEAGNKVAYTAGSETTATSTAGDIVPPTVNTATLTATNITTEGFDVNWTIATDNKTSQINLEYQVYYSTSDNISTWQNAEINGTPVGSYTKNIEIKTITNLSENTKYYYNVVVKDEAGNKTAYTTGSMTTAEIVNMFFGEYIDNIIYKADADGRNKIVFANKVNDAVSCPVAIGAGAGYVYWSNEGDERIYYKVADGSDSTKSFDIGGEAFSIDVDEENDKIYWADMSNNKIGRSNLDGTNIENFATNADSFGGDPISIAVGCGYVYWGTDTENKQVIKYKSEDGIETGEITTGLYIYGIVVDETNRRIYCADYVHRKIVSYDLTGGAPIDVARDLDDSGIGIFDGLSLYNNILYYSTENNRTIEYINIDGTGTGISQLNGDFLGGIAHE